MLGTDVTFIQDYENTAADDDASPTIGATLRCADPKIHSIANAQGMMRRT